MTSVNFSKQSSNWFKERQANLQSHDTVREDLTEVKALDVSQIRSQDNSKRIRGD